MDEQPHASAFVDERERVGTRCRRARAERAAVRVAERVTRVGALAAEREDRRSRVRAASLPASETSPAAPRLASPCLTRRTGPPRATASRTPSNLCSETACRSPRSRSRRSRSSRAKARPRARVDERRVRASGRGAAAASATQELQREYAVSTQAIGSSIATYARALARSLSSVVSPSTGPLALSLLRSGSL